MTSPDTPEPSQRRAASADPLGLPRRFRTLLSLLLFCLALGFGSPGVAAADEGPAGVSVTSFQVASAGELVRVLEQAWGGLGPDGSSAPGVAPRHLPPGLAELPVAVKKRAFLRAVLPLVVSVNAEVDRERQRLEAWAASAPGRGGRVPAGLLALARRYRVPGVGEVVAAGDVPGVLAELRLRVDQVPVSLALAQAALESGWGTSRFAVEGNSLFGQWVFSNRGMSPAERPSGARYSVARFGDLRASVAAYVRNLNTSWAYRGYRERRATMRGTESGALDAEALAGELLHYSTRREAYVAEVRAVIRGNRLRRFDGVRLAEEPGLARGSAPPTDELAMEARGGAVPPDA